MITKNTSVSLLLALYFVSFSSFGQQTHLACLPHYPTGQKLYDQYPQSLFMYYGVTSKGALLKIMRGGFQRYPEHVESFEYAYTLAEENPIRRFFSPLVGIVQLAANVSIRDGINQPTIYEFDPYIGFRWANWPWNHIIETSFAVAEGISYATSVPSLEKRTNNNTKRLLNYVMLEATFAAPSKPRLQLVARIHHRSGAYGLYHAGNTGSNVVGVGVRYLFD